MALLDVDDSRIFYLSHFMKRSFLLLGLCLGAVGAAQAQSATFGIKAGASLTNFTGKNIKDAKNKFGFNGGLIANFAVNDIFSVQPELLYSMKGAKTEETIAGLPIIGAITNNTTLHYVDVPVLAHMNAGGLFFELGPQIGFLASAKIKEELTNGQSSTYDVKDKIKNVDFGYAGGLGYQLKNGPGVGLRYNGGFSNLNKNGYSNGYDVRNSAFQLYATYMFGGK